VVWRALPVVVGLLVAAACGGAGSAVATQLTIERESGAATVLVPSQATLSCDGAASATGFLRDAAGPACDLVRRGDLQRVAAQQRRRRLCAQVYGGPQRARITGRVGGRRVDLTVTRADACGTADWQALEALLGNPQRSGRVQASAPTTSAPPTTAAPVTYQVMRGDTLSTIASRFGVPISAIVAINQLADPNHLAEGQRLLIPPVQPVVLTITPPEAPQGTGFQLKLTGAKPSESVTFEIVSPDRRRTGPPHVASADGVVTAAYQSGEGDAAGTHTVIAHGDQGTTTQATFVVDPPGAAPTGTTP
jgi:LysM repeat protein